MARKDFSSLAQDTADLGILSDEGDCTVDTVR
jgi:hypothetical protein